MSRTDLMEEAPVAWRHVSTGHPVDHAARDEIIARFRPELGDISSDFEPLYSASALAAAEARGREEALREMEAALSAAPIKDDTIMGIETAREIVWEMRAAIRRGTTGGGDE